jgi:tetratricopeptide (TPR) repeat protein
MATIVLLCNENYALTVRQSIESTQKQLANGELSQWAWSVGKQPIAKVGDRIYVQRTNTYPPAGYFATGRVVPAEPSEQLRFINKKYANFDVCYCNDFFEGKYVVQILIDSIVDYDLPLKLSDLEKRREFGEANFFVPEGHAFDEKYAVALNKAWEDHLVSAQQNGVSAFTVLSRKGNKYKQQKDFDSALQIYEKAFEIAKNVGDLSWTKFF